MVWGIDTTNPQAQTVESIENQLLESMFGSTPLGPLIPMLAPYLNQMLGLSGPGWRNPIMDSVVYSNMSPYGTYISQMQNNFSRVANDALNRQSNAARRGWLKNIGRAAMSFDSWKQTELGIAFGREARNEEELRQFYEDYISNEAAGRDNFLWQAGYKLLDPEGFEASRGYLSQAGANLIRTGVVNGRRSAYLQAKAVGGMFLDENGNYVYNSSDYGYMNVGETAAVVAAVTKDTDLFNDVGVSPDKLKEATKNLRNKVQEYTKALSPLKDVFGSDIPAMIGALESLSGQRLSQLDPTRMSEMVSRVMAGATVGGYDLGQVVNMRSRISAGLGQMNVPFINEMGALSQATTVLDATVTGYAPAAMTQERYANNAGEWIMRTSNSAGAEYLNLAYAVWRQQNPDGTFDQFRQQYDDLRKDLGADAAILKLGNATDFYNLRNQGYQSKYFLEAVQDDVGGRLSRTEHLNVLIGRGYMQAYGSQREAYTQAIEAVQKDAKLLTDNAYLEANTGENGLGLSDDVARQIVSIRQGYYGADLVTALHADAELRRKQPIKDKQLRLKKQLDDLKISFPDSIKGIISDFLGGKGDLKSLLSNSHALAAADEETRYMLEDIADATKIKMQDLDLKTKEEKQAWLEDQLTYGLTNGFTNEYYTEELIKFMDASKIQRDLNQKGKANWTAEDAQQFDIAGEAMDIASQGLLVSRYMDNQILTDFIGNDDNKRMAVYSTFDKILRRGGTIEEANQETLDYINTADIFEQLDKSQFGDLHGKLDKEFRKRLKKKSEASGELSRSDVMGIIDDLQRDSDFKDAGTAAFMRLKNYTNNSFNKEGSSDTNIQDLFGIITNAIEKMGELSEDMKKVVNIAASSAAPDNAEQAASRYRGRW